MHCLDEYMCSNSVNKKDAEKIRSCIRSQGQKLDNGWIALYDDLGECPYCHKYQKITTNIDGDFVSIYCQFCGKKIIHGGNKALP